VEKRELTNKLFATDRGDLFPIYCGRERCLPGHESQEVRNHHFLHVIAAGSGDVWHGTDCRRLSAGGGFLYRPGERAHYRADQRTPWTYYWIAFGGPRSVDCWEQCGIPADGIIPGPLPAAIHQPIEQLLALAGAEEVALDWTRQALSWRFLATLRGSLHPAPAPPVRDPARHAARAAAFLERHFSRHNLRISEVAAALHLERTYLAALFQTETGSSLRDYLAGLRMARAAELLQRGDLSIKEIASSVGYTDPFAFSRAFHRAHGQAPRDWRMRSENR